jgi:hypothetical protein
LGAGAFLEFQIKIVKKAVHTITDGFYPPPNKLNDRRKHQNLKALIIIYDIISIEHRIVPWTI